MEMLNRSAVTLKPRRPYLEWARRDDPRGESAEILRTMCEEPTTYLLPAYDDAAEGQQLLADSWPVLFEVMLAAWSDEEGVWPEPRTFALFREWFEVRLSGVVEDLLPDEPLDYYDLGEPLEGFE